MTEKRLDQYCKELIRFFRNFKISINIMRVMAAHTGEIKTVPGLLDIVLHAAAVAVKPDDIFRRKIHVCYDKCVHVYM